MGQISLSVTIPESAEASLVAIPAGYPQNGHKSAATTAKSFILV